QERKSGRRFAAAVAGYGLLLTNSPHLGTFTWEQCLELARSGRGADPEGERAELYRLVAAAGAERGCPGSRLSVHGFGLRPDGRRELPPGAFRALQRHGPRGVHGARHPHGPPRRRRARAAGDPGAGAVRPGRHPALRAAQRAQRDSRHRRGPDPPDPQVRAARRLDAPQPQPV
ncbi:MAG: DUF3520 domain-containing protein, partial [Opitutae bacterium]|nr:DUF3520 domain-containing protein [Opitutae bacterium]